MKIYRECENSLTFCHPVILQLLIAAIFFVTDCEDAKIHLYFYLPRSSFRCAALKKVDNDRKIFDFGGSRIWDGKTIISKIKGNSNLYILEQQVRICNFKAVSKLITNSHQNMCSQSTRE